MLIIIIAQNVLENMDSTLSNSCINIYCGQVYSDFGGNKPIMNKETNKILAP